MLNNFALFSPAKPNFELFLLWCWPLLSRERNPRAFFQFLKLEQTLRNSLLTASTDFLLSMQTLPKLGRLLHALHQRRLP
jgi:hypothetical protein